MWTKLAAEMNGRYIAGSFTKNDKVEVDHENWTLTLDTYTVSTGKSSTTYTRMRAPFVNLTGFRFSVSRKNIFSGIGKAFGMQDIEVGDPPFDHDFIIKANEEARMRRLLWVETIRDLLSKQRSIQFSVKDDEGFFVTSFPEG